MSHIQYTIKRSGSYFYNRRAPKHAVKSYGPFIRQTVSKCLEEAASYAQRLSNVLKGSWSKKAEIIKPVDIPAVISSLNLVLSLCLK